MDVWIVAAAAGAGYVCQRLKNLKARKHNSSDLLSKNLNFGEEICKQREDACYDASTSGFEGENLLDNLSSGNMVCDLDSLAGLFKTDEVLTSDSVPQPSSREIGYSYGFRRDRSRLRSRQISSKFIKPRTSLESCLMAQLYKEHAEIEEYTYCVDPSQKAIVRPFLVADGKKIINRAPHQSCCKPTRTGKCQQSKDTQPQDNKTVNCVPRLPSDVAVELEMEAKAGKKQILARSNARKVANRNQSNVQGTSDSNLLFVLGLTIGMSYSLSGHKQDIEKLRKSLKQTENLVQDLQDELEMKDVLTVKELSVEGYESPVHNDSYIDHAIQTLSLEQKLNCSSMYCNGENNDGNTKEESLKKIEAELEVELDRLHSNMNSSSKLEGKLSDVAELDPDFVSYAIKGDLRTDLFEAEKQDHTEREESSISTPCSHYPISPIELSLRLHEVIQSRLKERVKELKRELEYSERKINCMESEHIHPWREFPGHKTGSSSNHESPNATDDPIVIKLSGEALAAYNEVYDELTKLSESEEEENNHQETFHPDKLDLDNGSLDGGYMKQLCLPSNGSLETGFDRPDEEGADDTVLNDDESEDGEDEMERLLIRQIVEKAKQGSPAVLKAQRAFLSIHEY